MMVRWLLLSCLGFLAACGTAGSASKPFLQSDAQAAIERVANTQSGAGRIKADLAYLADDAREGRKTGSEGYLEAAAYVAARFESEGLLPGAKKGWLQTIDFVSAERDLDAAQMTYERSVGAAQSFTHLEDFLIGRSLASPSFDVTAPALFVGHGVSAGEDGYDDYAGVDAVGKIVIAFDGAPEFLPSEERAYYASTSTKHANAVAHGAIGFIALTTGDEAGDEKWERYIANPRSPAVTWLGPGGAPPSRISALKATARMSSNGGRALFEGAAKSFAELKGLLADKNVSFEAFELPAPIRLAGASRLARLQSPNVVGFLQGTDPILKNEIIVLSAHLDHEGICRSAEQNEDVICNGALDNAMGVATLLQIARLLKAEGAPRRSIIFLAVTGEEEGLLGAEYFARFSDLGEKEIVADVNIDMPLLLYPFTDVIAFGAEHSSLGDPIRKAAQEMALISLRIPFQSKGFSRGPIIIASCSKACHRHFCSWDSPTAERPYSRTS